MLVDGPAVRPPLVKSSVIGLGHVVGQVGERRDATVHRHCGRALSGPAPLASAAVTMRGVVAGHQVAVLVFFVDHRLGGERQARRRRRRRLRRGSPAGWPPRG